MFFSPIRFILTLCKSTITFRFVSTIVSTYSLILRSNLTGIDLKIQSNDDALKEHRWSPPLPWPFFSLLCKEHRNRSHVVFRHQTLVASWSRLSGRSTDVYSKKAKETIEKRSPLFAVDIQSLATPSTTFQSILCLLDLRRHSIFRRCAHQGFNVEFSTTNLAWLQSDASCWIL